MTSLDASPEGSALTPDGWVEGRATLEGPRIKAIEGRKLPKPAASGLVRNRLKGRPCGGRITTRLLA